MKTCRVYWDGEQIVGRAYGAGDAEIVVLAGLGASMAEWEPTALRWSARRGVLLYDRAGMGESAKACKPRTPERIAEELFALLEAVPHQAKMVLVAHSQGGLYAQQFARMYPDRVAGMVLLDPLTAEDDTFRTQLTKKAFAQSGVDKAAHLGFPRVLALCGLGGLLRSAMRKAPPLCLFPFSDAQKAQILDTYAQAKTYSTMIEEYRMAHDPANLAVLRATEGFPQVPLALVTHDSERMVQEIMRYGHADVETARQIETLWQTLMRNGLKLSGRSAAFRAEQSTHAMHLMQPDMVDTALAWVDATRDGAIV